MLYPWLDGEEELIKNKLRKVHNIKRQEGEIHKTRDRIFAFMCALQELEIT